MVQKYSTEKYDKENMARVVGRSLPISTKFCIEICNLIRNKSTEEAKKILQDAIDGKKAIPFKIFNRDLSHKKKMGPGRFPKKAAIEIINLLESAEANAQFKGLNTSNLSITHINAHLASRPWRYGRQRRRKAKRTHAEIVVAETKQSENKKEEKPKKSHKPKVSEGLETKSQSETPVEVKEKTEKKTSATQKESQAPQKQPERKEENKKGKEDKK